MTLSINPNTACRITRATDLARHTVDLPRYGLAPALLASVPSTGAITLNYDRLFESACRDSENIPAVGTDWLLKVHGSVSQPDSIVLTRDDYLGYSSNRDALSALVKAHLLTHHLLFVGFGLADDHFHEIVHDVRRALPNNATMDHQMGTVLSLFDEALQRLVGTGKLEIHSMSSAPVPNADPADVRIALATAGRELEIFLDMMAAYATDNHSYLLAPAYNQGSPLTNSTCGGSSLPWRAGNGQPVQPKCGGWSTRLSENWA